MIRVEERDTARWLVLDRPDARNALDEATVEALHAGVGGDRPIVITGSGTAFCAGGDLKFFRDARDDVPRLRRFFVAAERMMRAFMAHPAPTIACVNGVAVAGGLELCCAVDLVVASTTARFGDVHISRGLVPAGGSSSLLARFVGERHARWLLLSGEVIDADEAARIGFVNRVVAPDDLEVTAAQMAGVVGRHPKHAMARMRRLIELDPDIESERAAVLAMLQTPETMECLDAFAGERPLTGGV